jgi:3-deoxy-D-manno-octulosonic-acid transferase
MGELDAARPLAVALREAGHRVALSTMTRTGRAKAGSLEPDVGPFHLPIDAEPPVTRCLDRLRPAALILLETELWPTLLGVLSARGVPWGLASARLSDRSLRRMRRAGRMYRHVVESAGAIAARSEADAERFLALGAAPAVVRVTGDLKEDREPRPIEPAPNGRPVWIAACTRPDEERIVLEALRRVESVVPEGELLLAPRHPDRFEAVARLVGETGRPVRRWRDRDAAPGPGRWSVLLVDEMGVLDEAYRRAHLAFVGGSLVDRGGHSPLQAAEAGRPVLFGPHDDNCREVAVALERAGALRRVDGEESLAAALVEWLGSPEATAARGASAHRTIAGRAGATRRTLEFLRERGFPV